MASTTLTRLRIQVAAVIGTDVTSGSDDETLVTEWINEGMEQFMLDTGCVAKWATMSLTSGTHTYTLPTGAMAIHEVQNEQGGDSYRLERVTLQELVELRRRDGAAPARWYAVVGSNMLSLYPTPGSGETLTVWYVPRPTAMSTGSETPGDGTGNREIPAEFHKAVFEYAAARAAEYDQHGPSQYGTYFRALYEKSVRDCRKAMFGKGGRRPARATVGRAARRVSSDPSRTGGY